MWAVWAPIVAIFLCVAHILRLSSDVLKNTPQNDGRIACKCGCLSKCVCLYVNCTGCSPSCLLLITGIGSRTQYSGCVNNVELAYIGHAAQIIGDEC